MKNLSALTLATEVTWRARVLQPLIEQAPQTQAWREAQGLKKRGHPKKNDELPPAASVPLVTYTGLTARSEIPAVYWKLALMARVFGAQSLFELRQALEWAPANAGWQEWLGAEQVSDLLELPALTIRGREFVDSVSEQVYGVVCRGTKPISRGDVAGPRVWDPRASGPSSRVHVEDRVFGLASRDHEPRAVGVGDPQPPVLP